jgi:hypothetical protein
MSSEIYGPGSPTPPAVSVIDAPVGRKLNNALTMRFLEDGAEEPFATALQSGGDGAGKKLGILFGFKNGAPGAHAVTYADGGTLTVRTVDTGPSAVTRGDGSAVATIVRGETTTATAPDGAHLLTFSSDPTQPTASSHYRLRVVDGPGDLVATMDVIRTGGSYSTGDLVEALDLVTSGFQSGTGGSLPLPFAGIRTVVHRALTVWERDVIVAASVEIGIAVRPYVTAMGERGAAWT